MADKNRLPVDRFFQHHAVWPINDHLSKKQVAQAFSDSGKARAYRNGALYSGLINPYTGARSYSQAQVAGQRVTARTPDATAKERAAGYRVVPLVKDIWGQICWHAGNWNMNQRSIGIEHMGDYRTDRMRDGDLKVIADFWRAHDKKMNGKTFIMGHQQVSATLCPATIMNNIGTIVKYINNPPAAPKPASLYKVMINNKQVGAYSTITNAKKRLGKSIGKITKDSKTVFENKKPVTPKPAATVTKASQDAQDKKIKANTAKDAAQDKEIAEIKGLLARIVTFLGSIFKTNLDK